MNILGLDVGGANLKAADGRGAARTVRFALWRDPGGLTDALRSLLGSMPKFDRLALTMTGELCDCFETRRQGVLAILEGVMAAADGSQVKVWTIDGRFVEPGEVRSRPLQAAAANWLAEATFVGRFAPTGPALLIDIGSTTTDIIPLRDGKPTPIAKTDAERFQTGELSYTGVRRTPLATLLALDGASETFATVHDLYLALGLVPEDPNDRDTADGRPATKRHAFARIARMVCADLETCTQQELNRLTQLMMARHIIQMAASVQHVTSQMPGMPQTVVLAGSGEFLALSVLQRQVAFKPIHLVWLSRQLTAEVSTAACAHAVAVLAGERT
jgi:hypothetical protein